MVSGERGCFVADTLTADLTFHAERDRPGRLGHDGVVPGCGVGDVTRFAIAKEEPLLIELSAFRDAVRGEGDDVVGIRDAARTVAVAEAMIRGADSSATENPV